MFLLVPFDVVGLEGRQVAADERETVPVNIKRDHHGAFVGEDVAHAHRQRLLRNVRDRKREAHLQEHDDASLFYIIIYYIMIINIFL